jgi:hypothetical protein
MNADSGSVLFRSVLTAWVAAAIRGIVKSTATSWTLADLFFSPSKAHASAPLGSAWSLRRSQGRWQSVALPLGIVLKNDQIRQTELRLF